VSRIHATAEATISLWLTVATAPYDRRVRDLDTIDGELQIIAAVREAVRAVSGRTPSAAAMDALLDERLSHRVQGQSPPGHRADSRGIVALQACLDELGIVAERRREPPTDDHHAHVIRARRRGVRGAADCVRDPVV
jgi:hypothetical protein